MPRYYAHWHEPGCEGVDSWAFSWLGEVNWVNPPWSLLDEVAHKLREERCAATVVAPYWLGQMWFLPLEAMADVVVKLPRSRDLFPPSRLGGSELLGASSCIMFRISASRGAGGGWLGCGALGAPERGARGQLLTELAVQMQGAILGDKTVGNYRPKARVFMAFCEAEGREWLPATGATVRLYIGHMLDKGIVRTSNMQPYQSAVNHYHEHMGFHGPAKGRAVSRAVNGMSRLQVQAAEAAGKEQTVRTWLPARHVSAVHEHGLGLKPVGRAATELLKACTYVVLAFVTFVRPETGVSMCREHVRITTDDISVVLHKEKGRGHVRLRRRLTIPAAGVVGLCGSCSTGGRAVGAALEKCCSLGGWSQLSFAIHSYIDPATVPD
ncbi:hypothetical protein CYMTET_18396 [Cymbomonas tetramitiformis]|uniref:Uncharacterized protein n=1 Tax=Cymbomonas tetramitiformis TaxID=36881 RepID=A0AAE0G8B6_9CHLO|nr:hypothetical protein CYMTET_18396 [Cymbomonas tetramitiformis]